MLAMILYSKQVLYILAVLEQLESSKWTDDNNEDTDASYAALKAAHELHKKYLKDRFQPYYNINLINEIPFNKATRLANELQQEFGSVTVLDRSEVEFNIYVSKPNLEEVLKWLDQKGFAKASLFVPKEAEYVSPFLNWNDSLNYKTSLENTEPELVASIKKSPLYNTYISI